MLSHGVRRTCRIDTTKNQQYKFSFQGFIESHVNFLTSNNNLQKNKDALNGVVYI